LTTVSAKDLLNANIEARRATPNLSYYAFTATPRNQQAAWLSQIIARLNEIFITDGLTDKDLINYAYTIADKVRENAHVMHQVANNAPEQVMLGDFPAAVDDAVIDANERHQTQMMQYLNNPATQAGFQRLVLELVQAISAQATEG
jgi:type I restriction enzyme, R subunit